MRDETHLTRGESSYGGMSRTDWTPNRTHKRTGPFGSLLHISGGETVRPCVSFFFFFSFLFLFFTPTLFFFYFVLPLPIFPSYAFLKSSPTFPPPLYFTSSSLLLPSFLPHLVSTSFFTISLSLSLSFLSVVSLSLCFSPPFFNI